MPTPTQSASKFSLPTETVELPSKGLLYPKESPLSEGKIEMKYMTAKEEDILTNSNYIKNGTVLDKLLESLITTKINYDDLLVADKDALLIAARILGYGKDYSFQFRHPSTDQPETVTVDLTNLKEKSIPVEHILEEGKNEFKYVLPSTGTEISLKLLTIKDERDIDREIAGLKKAMPNVSPELTTRLKHIITAINGDRTPGAIRDFVDNHLLSRDSRPLRKFIQEITPGIELKFDYVSDSYTEEGVEIPMNTSFFWPEL
jgi:hypothetical protein